SWQSVSNHTDESLPTNMHANCSGQSATLEDEPHTRALRFLQSRLPCGNVTAAAQAGHFPPVIIEQEQQARHTFTSAASKLYALLPRILVRRQRHHARLVGDKGIGRTTVLHELARRSAAGESSFLADWPPSGSTASTSTLK